MFLRIGENWERKRTEQGLRAWQTELAQAESHGDRARARGRIHELQRQLVELDRWS
jgi:hypothetical protein